MGVDVGIFVFAGVLVGVDVGVFVFVGVLVGVFDFVGVDVGVFVFVGVLVGVFVFVGVDVGVNVGLTSWLADTGDKGHPKATINIKEMTGIKIFRIMVFSFYFPTLTTKYINPN